MPIDIVQEAASTFEVMVGERQVSGNHRELHVAIESAANESEACGCEPTIERIQRYRVKVTSPKESIPSTEENAVTLSWVHPTSRKNGETLLISDIKGYKIMLAKISQNVVVESTVTEISVSQAAVLPGFEGVNAVAIATVDTSDLVSDYSQFVNF